MRKVSWPTKNAVISSTILVGIATLALMIIIGIVDYGLGRVVKAIFMSS
ncbi:MAG: preprotein translocase subunit SecE [Myxococcales bacterium]|nr:preprotein translocase subunit SecE [Myxococcales bacterium]